MPYPPENKMPDLATLNSLTGRLAIQALIGDPGVNKKVALYRRNYIRLVDKAIQEYQDARAVILAQITESNRSPEAMQKSGRIVSFFGFTNHMENCLNALRRVYKLMQKIKAEGSPPLPRELRRLIEANDKPIADIRNAVEHMDDIIHEDELTPGNPVMLALTQDSNGASVSSYCLNFADLAKLLERVHQLGEHILLLK